MKTFNAVITCQIPDDMPQEEASKLLLMLNVGQHDAQLSVDEVWDESDETGEAERAVEIVIESVTPEMIY